MADIAIYIRISDEDIDVRTGKISESNSISSQRKLLLNYINNAPELAGRKVVEYFDDGTSGTYILKRDSFKEMLDAAKAGKIDCILVKDLSRFARNYISVGNIVELQLPLLGVRFIAVNDNFDTKQLNGATGGMEFALKNLFNQLYSMDISRKEKATREVLAKSGKYIGAYAPMGYKKDPQDKYKLIIDEDYAPIVQFMFEEVAAGKALIDVARQLNSRGVVKRKLATKQIRNELWRSEDISRVIRTEMYTGKLIQNRYEVIGFGDNKKYVERPRSEWIILDGLVPEIVSEELFAKAKGNLKIRPRGNRPEPPVNFFKCGHCGKKLGNGGKLGHHYYCKQKELAAGLKCKQVFIKKEILEDLIMQTVREACAMMLGKAETLKNRSAVYTMELNAKIGKLKKQLQMADADPSILYEKYKSGQLTREEFMSKRETQRQRTDRLTNELQHLTAELETLSAQPTVNTVDLTACKELQTYDRDTLAKIIDEVRVYSEKEIEIVFKCDDFYKHCLNMK